MRSKMIGFVGIEKYEIIHYLSRILFHLQQKVLLLDQSSERALACSIPVLYPGNKEIMDYNGVDVAEGLSTEAIGWLDYDYILVDLGFQVKHPLLAVCDEVYLVSDLQLHNIRNLSALSLEKHQERFLILKTFFANQINPRYIYEEMTPLMIREENSYALSLEEKDYENCLQCQYQNRISIKRISKGMKRMLCEMLSADFTKVQIDRAFRMAERGY
jgi:hypothetical protein